jgi:hypothetical protein
VFGQVTNRGRFAVKECSMNHHHHALSTTSPQDGPPGFAGPSGSDSATLSSASLDIQQQRRALQGQVEALRQAGALPSAAAAGQPGSTVQWNNWSNG